MRDELELFAHNLNVFMDRYKYTQTSLADAIGVANTTVSEWCNGRKFPRIGRIDQLTELFHCRRSDLLERYTTEESIQMARTQERLMAYMKRLNSEGYEKALTFFEDLNPKFYEGEQDV